MTPEGQVAAAAGGNYATLDSDGGSAYGVHGAGSNSHTHGHHKNEVKKVCYK